MCLKVGVTASNVFVSSMPKDVSEVSVYSYGVHNKILPGALEVFTPNHFLRYVRLIYRSQFPNPLN